MGRCTKPSSSQEGIGLYTHEQSKTTTPFQYFAQVIIGTIVASVGALAVYGMLILRAEEIRIFGSAEAHVWGWIFSFAVLAIGLFQAHAGAIFWSRRIANRIGVKSRKPIQS